MQLWLRISLFLIAVLLSALFFTELGRYAKTAWLILRVTPYEQTGTGAGSILVYGDSTGYGTGAQTAGDSVAGRLGAAYPGYTIVNDSENGRRLATALSHAPDVTGTYDLILIQLGANDLIATQAPQAVVTGMRELIERLAPHAEHFVIITSGNIGAAPAFKGEEAARLTAVSREYTNLMLAYAADTPAVDYVPLFEEPANDPFVLEPERYMAVDGLHPSSAGYRLWYMSASRYFEAALAPTDE